MVILFVIEFRDFLTIHVAEELFVDTSRTPTMKINFDVTFPRISCQCNILSLSFYYWFKSHIYFWIFF